MSPHLQLRSPSHSHYPPPVRIPKLAVRNRSNLDAPSDSTGHSPLSPSASSFGLSEDDGSSTFDYPPRLDRNSPLPSPSAMSSSNASSFTHHSSLSHRCSFDANSMMSAAPPKARKSRSVMGFFTVKEPSMSALDHFANQQRQQARDKPGGDMALTAGGFAVPKKKLPASVPKVNSKWDGVPRCMSKTEQPQEVPTPGSSISLGSSLGQGARWESLESMPSGRSACSTSSSHQRRLAGASNLSVGGGILPPPSPSIISMRSQTSSSHGAIPPGWDVIPRVPEIPSKPGTQGSMPLTVADSFVEDEQAGFPTALNVPDMALSTEPPTDAPTPAEELPGTSLEGGFNTHSPRAEHLKTTFPRPRPLSLSTDQAHDSQSIIQPHAVPLEIDLPPESRASHYHDALEHVDSNTLASEAIVNEIKIAPTVVVSTDDLSSDGLAACRNVRRAGSIKTLPKVTVRQVFAADSSPIDDVPSPLPSPRLPPSYTSTQSPDAELSTPTLASNRTAPSATRPKHTPLVIRESSADFSLTITSSTAPIIASASHETMLPPPAQAATAPEGQQMHAGDNNSRRRTGFWRRAKEADDPLLYATSSSTSMAMAPLTSTASKGSGTDLHNPPSTSPLPRKKSFPTLAFWKK